MSLGVMLTRAQPFHNGHMSLLEKILNENDKALILIGSSEKSGTERNPFPVVIREFFIRTMLSNSDITRERFVRGDIQIESLRDWENENNSTSLNRWGHYLYYSIVYLTGCKKFNYYYADDKKTLDTWFDSEISNDIEVITVDRNQSAGAISSTRIREELAKGVTKESLEFIANNIPVKDIRVAKRLIEYHKYYLKGGRNK